MLYSGWSPERSTAAYRDAYELFADRFVDASAVNASVQEKLKEGWNPSLAAGLAQAERDGKPVFIGDTLSTTTKVVGLRQNKSKAGRDATGMVALEIAMDELAYKLKMDPLALRLKNYAERTPVDDKPYSSKELRACYEQGAEKFGWAKRPLAPRSTLPCVTRQPATLPCFEMLNTCLIVA